MAAAYRGSPVAVLVPPKRAISAPLAGVYIGGLVTCPYCSANPEDAWILTDDVVASPHPTPLTAFHLVVAPRRHVATFYDLDVAEQRHVWDVLSVLRDRIGSTVPVQGFDVGFVDGGDGDADAHT